jgi:hypothetical protein
VQVKAAATEAGTATFKLVGNRDIEHIVDDLLHCVARPTEVSDVVTKLSATTFVQVGGHCWGQVLQLQPGGGDELKEQKTQGGRRRRGFTSTGAGSFISAGVGGGCWVRAAAFFFLVGREEEKRFQALVVGVGFGQQHPAEDTRQSAILAIKQLLSVIIDTHTPPPSLALS